MKTSLTAILSTSLIGFAIFISIVKQTSQTTAAALGATSDSDGFLSAAAEAEKLRVNRRISAETFVRMASEPDTIILDARGADDFARLRIKGSINLPYTGMAAESLQRLIPQQNTRILIYCRNNFVNTRPKNLPTNPDKADGIPYPDEFEPPLIPKALEAGLNIPTYITLYIYGYRNVWELNPAVDPNQTGIEFESGLPARK